MENVALTRQATAGRIITIVALCFIASFTLTPAPEQAEAVARTSPWCFLGCDDLGLLDIILNVLLFVPLGIGLGLLRGWRTAIGIGLVTSLIIELTQLHLIAGRDASLRDVVTNTLGAALGAGLVLSWRPVILPRAETAARLAVGGGVAWLAMLTLTGVAYQPDLPRSTWFGQWAPELGQFDTFPGTVQDVHLDDMFLPGGRLVASGSVRARLLTHRYTIRVSLVSGPPTDGEAPIFSIFDDEQREILVLAQDGDRVHFRTRTLGGSLELRTPSVRLDGFPTQPGVPLEIVVSRSGPETKLTLESQGQPRDWTHNRTVGDGWALLIPWNYAFGPEASLWTALWLGGLLFPAGYWAGRSGRSRVTGLLLGALIVFGLGLLPSALHVAISPWSQWAGSAAGSAAGWFLGRTT